MLLLQFPSSFICHLLLLWWLNRTNECYNEDDWATYEGSESIPAYFKSKELPIKAAWKFMEENNPAFTLSCINPGMVAATS